MATQAQLDKLLAIRCGWCAAPPGELCSALAQGGRSNRDAEGGVRRGRRRELRTLDGGCHDARWRAADLGTAPVLTAVVAELHPHLEPAEASQPDRQPVAVGAVVERPW